MNSFSSIEIGKRSLMAHTQGMNVIGHNVSNASVEGYSRQRITFESTVPLYDPSLNRAETPGQIGQGVDISSIRRVRDEILESRIIANSHREEYWNTRDKYILMLEQLHNEPSEVSVRGRMDKFWNSWQNLSVYPDSQEIRHEIIARGNALTESVRNRSYNLDTIQNMLNDDIEATVMRVNDITHTIATLNNEITQSKNMGDFPNDKLDRRDLLLNELASLINITTQNQDSDDFSVYTNGIHIIEGKQFRQLDLTLDPLNKGQSQLIWNDTGDTAAIQGGKLGALFQLRNDDVKTEFDNLDSMTINFIDLVNNIHRRSYGLNSETNNDFFVQYPFVNNSNGNFDSDNDGEFDSSYIFRVHGKNILDPHEQIGLSGTITLSGRDENIIIEYFPTDTTQNIITRINQSDTEVVASLNEQNQLQLKGIPAHNPENPDFVIRHIEDDGQFLVGYAGILANSGAENAYIFQNIDAVNALYENNNNFAVAPVINSSAWFEVSERIQNNSALVAASFTIDSDNSVINNGDAALAMARIRNSAIMLGKMTTFDNYFSNAVAEIGLKGQEAQFAYQHESLIMKDLHDLRESTSGVNIDEEISNMVKFQHGYNAAARFVSEIDRMLDTIINRMAV